MSEVLKFVFKGNRNYVQGTSLFNALVEVAGQRGAAEGKINVSFKHMIHNPVCILDERAPTAADAVVAKIAGTDGESHFLCINAATETEEAVRQEFDEPEACRGSIVGDKSIVQDKPHHADRIELLVSLCKKMHQECVDSSKKWVFSRYDGQFPIPEMDKVELRITKQVGTRLTCSDVLVNGEKIADMYFS
ncbi:hypothetical protein LO767_04805 [Halopseudomonas aestusnigri]|uniref:hypothetical protein n=1 Tax=Halopseudomonas aestusnigri TaxID=857252 RepID=UPI001E3A5C93|nr:hypothetical protein [Halopseudomonas aestusnigri]UGV31812.1 hypothetical protein LO767_04805 [Halopseudomonas aestusnigri]